MRTTNISKNDNLLKTRTVQIYVIASQPDRFDFSV